MREASLLGVTGFGEGEAKCALPIHNAEQGAKTGSVILPMR
jgi:hypothetical protein